MMKGNKVNGNKTANMVENRSFYQKCSVAAWGMIMWDPVSKEEVSKLHQKATANHKEVQQLSESAQNALDKSEKMLLSPQG